MELYFRNSKSYIYKDFEFRRYSEAAGLTVAGMEMITMGGKPVVRISLVLETGEMITSTVWPRYVIGTPLKGGPIKDFSFRIGKMREEDEWGSPKWVSLTFSDGTTWVPSEKVVDAPAPAA